jgi:hypothetical protein
VPFTVATVRTIETSWLIGCNPVSMFGRNSFHSFREKLIGWGKLNGEHQSEPLRIRQQRLLHLIKVCPFIINSKTQIQTQVYVPPYSRLKLLKKRFKLLLRPVYACFRLDQQYPQKRNYTLPIHPKKGCLEVEKPTTILLLST